MEHLFRKLKQFRWIATRHVKKYQQFAFTPAIYLGNLSGFMSSITEHYTYLQAMGIDLWLLKSTYVAQKESEHLIISEPEQESKPTAPKTESATSHYTSSARQPDQQQGHPRPTDPPLLGQQNIALIQTQNVLAIAVAGKHINLPAAYLELIERMLNRCAVDTNGIKHSVLDTARLYNDLGFDDNSIINAVLVYIDKKQREHKLDWIILLGSSLNPLADKLKSIPYFRHILIKQEVIDLLSLPETRKEAWQRLLPLRTNRQNHAE